MEQDINGEHVSTAPELYEPPQSTLHAPDRDVPSRPAANEAIAPNSQSSAAADTPAGNDEHPPVILPSADAANLTPADQVRTRSAGPEAWEVVNQVLADTAMEFRADGATTRTFVRRLQERLFEVQEQVLRGRTRSFGVLRLEESAVREASEAFFPVLQTYRLTLAAAVDLARQCPLATFASSPLGGELKTLATVICQYLRMADLYRMGHLQSGGAAPLNGAELIVACRNFTGRTPPRTLVRGLCTWWLPNWCSDGRRVDRGVEDPGELLGSGGIGSMDPFDVRLPHVATALFGVVWGLAHLRAGSGSSTRSHPFSSLYHYLNTLDSSPYMVAENDALLAHCLIGTVSPLTASETLWKCHELLTWVPLNENALPGAARRLDYTREQPLPALIHYCGYAHLTRHRDRSAMYWALMAFRAHPGASQPPYPAPRLQLQYDHPPGSAPSIGTYGVIADRQIYLALTRKDGRYKSRAKSLIACLQRDLEGALDTPNLELACENIARIGNQYQLANRNIQEVIGMLTRIELTQCDCQACRSITRGRQEVPYLGHLVGRGQLSSNMGEEATPAPQPEPLNEDAFTMVQGLQPSADPQPSDAESRVSNLHFLQDEPHLDIVMEVEQPLGWRGTLNKSVHTATGLEEGQVSSEVAAAILDTAPNVKYATAAAISAATNSPLITELGSVGNKPACYAKRRLGFWRRIAWLWRARVVGWLTAAETVVYFRLADKGTTEARASLATLCFNARYDQGRMPGCPLYSDMDIKVGESTDGTPIIRRFPHVLQPSEARHTGGEGSQRRYGLTPIWCYFRRIHLYACKFGIAERATPEQRRAQRAKAHSHIDHWRLYVRGHEAKYGTGSALVIFGGVLPGGHLVGAHVCGISTAGIDIDGRRYDFNKAFEGRFPPVTFTQGSALIPEIRDAARATVPWARLMGYFGSLLCGPQTSLANIGSRQGDPTQQTMTADLAQSERDFIAKGIAYAGENVPGSLRLMRDHPHVLVDGFHTGEHNADRHVIYHNAAAPIMIDESLDSIATYLRSHSCGGDLRPIQHLGPDDVPVFLGRRDPSNPSRMVCRSWACCRGDIFSSWSSPPPGVTWAMLAASIGLPHCLARNLKQLQNALAPRLGALVSCELVMWSMHHQFGYPVVSPDEATQHPDLMAWASSLLASPLVRPLGLGVRTVFLIHVPVGANPPTVSLTAGGKVPSFTLERLGLTLMASIAHAISTAVPALHLRPEHLRFVGAVESSIVKALTGQTDGAVVVFSDFIGDSSQGVAPLRPFDLHAQLVALQVAAREGRHQGSLDLTLLGSFAHTTVARRRGLDRLPQPFPKRAWLYQPPFTFTSHSIYGAITLHGEGPQGSFDESQPSPVDALFEPDELFKTGKQAEESLQAPEQEESTGKAPVFALTAAGEALFQLQLEELAGSAPSAWVPKGQVKLLTSGRPRERRARVIPDSHFVVNRTFEGKRARYNRARLRILGKEDVDLARPEVNTEGQIQRMPQPVQRMAASIALSHQGHVLVHARGRQLHLFADAWIPKVDGAEASACALRHITSSPRGTISNAAAVAAGIEEPGLALHRAFAPWLGGSTTLAADAVDPRSPEQAAMYAIGVFIRWHVPRRGYPWHLMGLSHLGNSTFFDSCNVSTPRYAGGVMRESSPKLALNAAIRTACRRATGSIAYVVSTLSPSLERAPGRTVKTMVFATDLGKGVAFPAVRNVPTCESPFSVDGALVVDCANLVQGSVYRCPVELLISHFQTSDRRQLGAVVEMLQLGGSTGRDRGDAAPAFVCNLVGVSPGSVAFTTLVMNTVMGPGPLAYREPRFVVSFQGDPITASSCALLSNGYDDSWDSSDRPDDFLNGSDRPSPLRNAHDYSNRPWIELVFDVRFWSALRLGDKIWESRFYHGKYKEVHQGTLCRCTVKQSNRGGGHVLGSDLVMWFVVDEVSIASTFWELYGIHKHNLIPGIPSDYGPLSRRLDNQSLQRFEARDAAARESMRASFFALRSNVLKPRARPRHRWTRAEINSLYHSVYSFQYPTVEQWDRCQRGHSPAVAWRLRPLGPSCKTPSSEPLNPRKPRVVAANVAAGSNLGALQSSRALIRLQARIRGYLAKRRSTATRAASRLAGRERLFSEALAQPLSGLWACSASVISRCWRARRPLERNGGLTTHTALCPQGDRLCLPHVAAQACVACRYGEAIHEGVVLALTSLPGIAFIAPKVTGMLLAASTEREAEQLACAPEVCAETMAVNVMPMLERRVSMLQRWTRRRLAAATLQRWYRRMHTIDRQLYKLSRFLISSVEWARVTAILEVIASRSENVELSVPPTERGPGAGVGKEARSASALQRWWRRVNTAERQLRRLSRSLRGVRGVESSRRQEDFDMSFSELEEGRRAILESPHVRTQVNAVAAWILEVAKRRIVPLCTQRSYLLPPRCRTSQGKGKGRLPPGLLPQVLERARQVHLRAVGMAHVAPLLGWPCTRTEVVTEIHRITMDEYGASALALDHADSGLAHLRSDMRGVGWAEEREVRLTAVLEPLVYGLLLRRAGERPGDAVGVTVDTVVSMLLHFEDFEIIGMISSPHSLQESVEAIIAPAVSSAGASARGAQPVSPLQSASRVGSDGPTSQSPAPSLLEQSQPDPAAGLSPTAGRDSPPVVDVTEAVGRLQAAARMFVRNLRFPPMTRTIVSSRIPVAAARPPSPAAPAGAVFQQVGEEERGLCFSGQGYKRDLQRSYIADLDVKQVLNRRQKKEQAKLRYAGAASDLNIGADAPPTASEMKDLKAERIQSHVRRWLSRKRLQLRAGRAAARFKHFAILALTRTEREDLKAKRIQSHVRRWLSRKRLQLLAGRAAARFKSARTIQTHARRGRAIRKVRVLEAIQSIQRKHFSSIAKDLLAVFDRTGSKDPPSLAEAADASKAARARLAKDSKDALPEETAMYSAILTELETRIEDTQSEDGLTDDEDASAGSNRGRAARRKISPPEQKTTPPSGNPASTEAQAGAFLSFMQEARRVQQLQAASEREAIDAAYRAVLKEHLGCTNMALTHAVQGHTVQVNLIQPSTRPRSLLDPLFKISSRPGIQRPVYLTEVTACNETRCARVDVLLMGDTGSGTCLIGERDFNHLKSLGLARRAPALASSVTHIAGVGAINQVLYHASFRLSIGGAIVEFEDVPVLNAHQGILLGNDFHGVTRTSYKFGSDGKGNDGFIQLFDANDESVSERVPFSHSGGEGRAVTSLVESATPIAYTPKAIEIPAWSEAIIRVRIPAAATGDRTLALVPLDDERVKELPFLIAPCLVKPDADGFAPLRVINPSRKKVRATDLQAVARFIVDPEISGIDLEFTEDEIIDRITVDAGCSAYNHEQIRLLLRSRRRLFASQLGWAQGYQHDIVLPEGAIPPSFPDRRLAPDEYAALKANIDKQLKAGLIESCSSPFKARAFTVPKPGSTDKRVVIDYRALNSLLESSTTSYPLPDVQMNLNSLAKAKWFTAIDLLMGFHQVELTDRAKDATAFGTPWGQYRYRRLPMGLASSPGAFMRVVDAALRGLPAGIAVAYVDDILVPTDGDFDQHMRDVGMVFDRLVEAGFTVNPKKVFLGMREVPYLGYLVGAYGTRPNPERTKALFDLTFEHVKGNEKAAARFVGMISFYSRFIKNLHIVLAPFHELKSKHADTGRLLDSLRLRASFTYLRNALAEVTALTRPDYAKDFHIHIDAASSVGIGGVIQQREDPDDSNSLRPIAFWSHKFTENEKGWPVRDQECWGLVSALREWRHYALGSHTKVHTDHRSLKWLLTTHHAQGSRVQQWATDIQHFDVDINYIPGVDNVVADFFSRATVETTTACIHAIFTETLGVAKEAVCHDADGTTAVTTAAHALRPAALRVAAMVICNQGGKHHVLVCKQDNALSFISAPVAGYRTYRRALLASCKEFFSNETYNLLFPYLAQAYKYRPKTMSAAFFFSVVVPSSLQLSARDQGSETWFAPIDSDLASELQFDDDAAFLLNFVDAVGPRVRARGRWHDCNFSRLFKPANAAKVTHLDAAPRLRSPNLPQFTVGDTKPSFCETWATGQQAAQITHDLALQAPNPAVALDLEGHLGGPHAHIALTQTGSSDQTEAPAKRVFVYDTHICPQLLSRPDSGLRAMIEDPRVAKIVHNCHGDAWALQHEHNIAPQFLFDTGIADSVLCGTHPNSSRGLAPVLLHWLGETVVHLTHKGNLVHIPYMFNKRPLPQDLFVYSYEDVEYCVDLYLTMREELIKVGLLEITIQLAHDRCYPVPRHIPEHPQLVVVVVDATHMICVVQDGLYSLPASGCSTDICLPDDKSYRAAIPQVWLQTFDKPPKGRLATALSNHARRPRRVGPYFVSYVIVPTLLTEGGDPVYGALTPCALTATMSIRSRQLSKDELSRVGENQHTLFQSIGVDSRAGISQPKIHSTRPRPRKPPRQAAVARAAQAVHIIQRAFRERLSNTQTAISNVVVGKVASLERSAIILFDDTHCYMLRGRASNNPWRFPSLSIPIGGVPLDTAIAALDMFMGSAVRRGSPDSPEQESAWKQMPNLSRLINQGLQESVKVGPETLTRYYTCYVPHLQDHIASFIAARMDHNGFRCTPTLRVQYPSFYLGTHPTALLNLQKEDRAAFKAALLHQAQSQRVGSGHAIVEPDVIQAPQLRDGPLISRTGVTMCTRALGIQQTPTAALASQGDFILEQTALSFDRCIAMVNRSIAIFPAALQSIVGSSADSALPRHSGVHPATRTHGEDPVDTTPSPAKAVEAVEAVEAVAQETGEVAQSVHEPLTETVPGLPKDTSGDPDQASAAGTKPSIGLPNLAELRTAQQHPAIEPFIHFILSGDAPTFESKQEANEFVATAKSLYIDEEFTLRRRTSSRGEAGPVVLPPQYRAAVLQTYHDHAGHLGISKAWKLVKSRYWWPKARAYVRTYIRLCRPCRMHKIPRHSVGRARMANNATSPWADVSCDVYDVGWDSGGYTKVLSFNDYFSRGVLCIPLTTEANSEDIADAVVHYLIRFHGKPLSIRSDRGSILISELIRTLYDKYNIEMKEGTAYHHETVGLTERWNSTLKSLLATHKIASGDTRWHLYLPMLEFAYNSAVNASTGYSPFFIMHLRHPTLPLDILSGRPHHGKELPAYIEEHMERLRVVWAVVTKNLHLLSLNRVQKADLKREIKVVYRPGDRVLLVKGKHVDGVLPKAEEPTEGPYIVLEQLDQGNYVLGDLRSRRMHDVLHEKRLLPYPSRRLNTMQEIAERYTVERVVDRKFFNIGGERVLKYRIRWAGFERVSDSWRSMDHLHDIAELVAAYNKLVPLPEEEISTILPLEEPLDNSQPPPSSVALQKRHFRPLSGEAQPPPTTQPPSANELAARFAPGTPVEMLYESIEPDSEPSWWKGRITRSRPMEPHDLSYSVRFFDTAYKGKVFGGYLYSHNNLRTIEGIKEYIAPALAPPPQLAEPAHVQQPGPHPTAPRTRSVHEGELLPARTIVAPTLETDLSRQAVLRRGSRIAPTRSVPTGTRRSPRLANIPE